MCFSSAFFFLCLLTEESVLQTLGHQVCVNTTTSHVHFRSVDFSKEFSYRLKVKKLVWNDLKHVENHEYIDQ